MDILKPSLKTGNSPAKPNTGRRSFIWKMGAAMSAALASVAPGMSNSRIIRNAGLETEVDRLSNQLGVLEDKNSIRRLHRKYEACLDSGMYAEAVELFAEDGEVVFNGGIFEGKSKGVSRLYCDCFRQGSTGRKIGPVPDLQVDTGQQQEIIEVAADRLSAKAQFPYSIQVGTPMAADLQLVQMARLHGEGVIKWCESGAYEVSYAKDVKTGDWKIRRLEYRASSKTDYRPGKPYAEPVSVPLFANTYPKDRVGPDRILAPERLNRKA